MPPIPSTNAPQTGLPAIFYWGLVGFAALLLAARFYFPSGKDRLAAKGQNETSAIAILQAQISTLQAEIRGMKIELRRLTLNEDGSREYRHALANRSQVFLASYEAAYLLMSDILVEVKDVPEYLKRRAAQLKSPEQLEKSNPIKEVRQYTVEEIEKIERGEEVS